jgi:translation initiation factor 1A
MPKNKGKVRLIASFRKPLYLQPAITTTFSPQSQLSLQPSLITSTLFALSFCWKFFISQGGKNRRRGKNENDNEKRELTFKEEGQEYAQVLKMLGNGRLEALCFDGEKRLAHIRGKLRKKVWINQGDIILLSLRDYQDEKGDVILKYSADEARSLKAYGELPESAKINETDTYGHEGVDDNVEFDEDRDSESDKEVDIDDIWAGRLEMKVKTTWRKNGYARTIQRMDAKMINANNAFTITQLHSETALLPNWILEFWRIKATIDCRLAGVKASWSDGRTLSSVPFYFSWMATLHSIISAA